MPSEALQKSTRLRSQFFKHEDHQDVLRWNLDLHPTVVKECARNALGDFFHPTHARLAADDGRKHFWSSRRHRKNLYKKPSGQFRSNWHGIANMRHLEYWNVSWWVAVAFTLGSIVWVINGFAVFLPFCNSHFTTAHNSPGWTAFVGATIFEIGSVFGILEAWNRDDVASFGWIVENAISTQFNNKEKQGSSSPEVRDPSPDSKHRSEPPKSTWIWFSLVGKYFREMGFLAAFFQLLAATVFWISGFTAIPGIQTSLMKHTHLNDGIFWSPQVIGGTGIIISATFIMLEAQTVWWKPSILSFGWQVGVWNFIGAIGFTLSGAFGYAPTNSGAQYQSALSTFWGGWAFLIGSIIQWYECVNR